jgi:DNA mismatch endonuclease (patch repair protein)
MDTLSPANRSHIMSLVRSKDTKPEKVVRRLVSSLGFRYRLHRRDLPGTPDLVFPKLRRVIFVHGCFWHQHSCAAGDRIPKSRADFWRAKLRGNAARDGRVVGRLRRKGWGVMTVWECELTNAHKLTSRLLRFLNG